MRKAVRTRDKLFAKFKNSKHQDDHETYKVARDNVQRMIKSKMKNFVVDKLSQNIGKPEELWKLLKSLRLPSKQKLSSSLCLKKDGNLSFDPETNAEIFKDFYSNLANDLVKQLPTPPKKFRKETIKNYYKMLKLNGKTFSF